MKNNFQLKIKSLFLLSLLIPFLGISQSKNVISTNRIFPKVDKVLEFEKALANHAQKYHTGDVRWRVFEIASGPDAGGYHVVEGPKTWESEDARGDINEAHNNDWNKSVTIYLTDRGSSGYSVYIDSLSTVAVGDYSDKVQINHIYPKPGCGAKVLTMLKNLKKVWAADGMSVAVYEVNASGAPQFAIARRFKQGLKEKTEGFRKPFKETYEKVHGKGSFDLYIDNISEYTNDSWSELIFYRADLSSK
ncbi:hypothetical protein [Flavobacterium sangjuense]|uniref:Uncharacterized protein n=1 Tax=Flavobacterium sangjuense TaxID=2518177 RepID=A0A4P7PSY8_9FLAO|nr:hypothetical protein [Flavobacterium sangjuense]QBZ98048.1 hypothetical protein GS03_01548 [Flavobacterium sangjuense]